MEQKTVFGDFTNLYEISKTLRFELKPTEKTVDLMRDNGIIERDELRDQDYGIIKPLFDQIHDSFIRESLEKINMGDWVDFSKFYDEHRREIRSLSEKKKVEKDEKKKEIIEKEISTKNNDLNKRLTDLRIKVANFYEHTAVEWNQKFTDIYESTEKKKQNPKKSGEVKKSTVFIEDKKSLYFLTANIFSVLPTIYAKDGEIIGIIEKNKKVTEMLQHKFEFYLKKIKTSKPSDFETGNTNNWWEKLYNEDAEVKIFTQIQAQVYISDILEKIKNKDVQEMKNQVLRVIANFNGFFTYFSGYNLNRANYYSTEDKTTGVANRIVNQNFITFLQNRDLLEKIKQQINLSETEKSIFESGAYNDYLHQDGIDTYNAIIGRKSDKSHEGEKGINQRLNEYAQNHKTKRVQLTSLYKQIGSLRENTIPFELVETDDELKEKIGTMISLSSEYAPKIETLLLGVFQDESEDEKELEKIYISRNRLSSLSNRYFSGWYAIAEKGVELKIFDKKKKSEEGEDIRIPAYVSIADLKEILESIEFINQSDLEEEKRTYLFKKRYEDTRNGETNNWKMFQRVWNEDIQRVFRTGNKFFAEVKEGQQEEVCVMSFAELLEQIKPLQNIFDKTRKEHREALKTFSDASIQILQLLKTFGVDRDKVPETSDLFYAGDEGYDAIIQGYAISKHYDAVRNYITKKAFSEDKIKLNFDSGSLLSGWNSDFKTHGAMIFRKGDRFYLGIVHGKGWSKGDILRLSDGSDISNIAMKMRLNVQKPDNKNTPRLFIRSKGDNFAPAVVQYNLPVHEIIDIYDNKLFSPNKKSPETHLPYLIKLIDYFKLGFSLHESYKDFTFQWKESSAYDNIAQFYQDVMDSCYELNWEGINFGILNNFVEEKRIFLYQIYSKDFSENSAGKKNIQTLLFLDLMKTENNNFLKLLGQGEVFLRKGSISKRDQITTKDNKYVINKGEKDPVHLQRYTEDKFTLHFPITIKGRNLQTSFNVFLNEKITSSNLEDWHIIGIDRGEKHLAFYSVINAKTGKIIEQGTLNIIEQVRPNGEKVYIDYEELLSERAGDRLKARQEWEAIGNIKNLKEGYISHVVKKIADLVLKYNGVVVMEKLNGGFKRGRQKIEQSVYQNLELALAKKLSYLVNKDAKEGAIGSVTRAYQLCPQVKLYGDIGKCNQWGVLFYTSANYTSITDPVSGWRKNIYLKKGTKDEMKEQIHHFSEIRYDEDKQAYFFRYNPKDFGEKGKGVSREWTVWSGIERYRGSIDNHGIWKSKPINTTDELHKLFGKYQLETGREILSQIEENPNLSSEFYQTLIWIIEVITQIRNTIEISKGEKMDVILSPVEPFFDSRKYYKETDSEKTNSVEFPTSGDANGAYNIARKGKMMLERIHKNPQEKNLYISDMDWDFEVQKKLKKSL